MHDRLEPRSRTHARTMVIITTTLRILFRYLHDFRRKGYICLLVLFFIQRRRMSNVVARDNNRVLVTCVYLGHRLSTAAASPYRLSVGRGGRSSRDLARRRCLQPFFSKQLASVIIITKNKCNRTQ